MRIVPLMGGAPRVFLASSPVQTPPWNACVAGRVSRLVYHTADAGDPMFVTDRTGANPHRILINKPGIHNHYPVWSRDGQWIYFVRGSPTTSQMDLWRISANGGEPAALHEAQRTGLSSPAPLNVRTVVFAAAARSGQFGALAVGRVNRRQRPLTGSASVWRKVRHRCRQRRRRHLVATRVGEPDRACGAMPDPLEQVAGRAGHKAVPAVGTVRDLGPRFRRNITLLLSVLSLAQATGCGASRVRPEPRSPGRLRRGAHWTLPPFPRTDGAWRSAASQWETLTLHLATSQGQREFGRWESP